MKNAAIKPIYDITPFTTLDFPDHLACIVWFSGCNMRCPYCYNPDIVLQDGNKTIDEFLTFLKSRVNRLEGVVLSGGESTFFKELPLLCKNIRELGFKIKIDTNGSNPDMLKYLLQDSLIDYVALDFKAPQKLYKLVTKSIFYDKTLKSLNILNSSGIDFEVRTTIHADLLDEDSINDIIEILYMNNYRGKYYLQNYLHTDETLGDLKEQRKIFDKNLLNDKIQVILRNF